MTDTPETPAPTTKKRRGFAVMTPEKRQEIAARGGRRAHTLGKAHRFNPTEAKKAGSKGGLSSSAKRKAQREAKKENPEPTV